MMIAQEEKAKIIKAYGKHADDTGSTGVQVALLTARIKGLTEHFKLHSGDHHSRRGLLKIVGKRRRLLDYLKRENLDMYKELIQRLNIRK